MPASHRPKPLCHRSMLFLFWNRHPSRMKKIIICCTLLLVVILFMVHKEKNSDPLLSVEELDKLVQELRGGDLRLMRWNAKKHTRRRQSDGMCDDYLSEALRTITFSPSSAAQGLACELATFCITDNPTQRSRLEDNHSTAITKLVGSKNSHTAAMASHLIYIASFSNQQNQQGFFHAGAITQLAAIVKNNESSKLAIMWSAAALQNLAASYCNTKGDGRCYWGWKKENDIVLVIDPKMEVVSDGDAIRKEILADSDLIHALKNLACLGPIRGEMTEENPYVGQNAKIGGVHDNSSNIAAWAATGALKNLALEPKARPLIEEDNMLRCICRLAYSPDWLEENKGQGALHHLRPSDPCRFHDNDNKKGQLCVEDLFVDKDGYTCIDYVAATKQECLAKSEHGITAEKACCGCGGGNPEK